MNRFRPLLPGACLLAVILSLGGCDRGVSSDAPPLASPSPGGGGSGKLTVAVIPKGTTHSYWKSVRTGAQKAADELGVEMAWKGPLKEDDRAEQITIVEQFVSQGISGILLAPLDDVALRRPVFSATEKKIPVVIIDSSLKAELGRDYTGFVATNNRAGGRMAGEEMVRLLGGKGKVAILRYAEGSASTVDREAGFLEVIRANPGLEVIVENRYGGVTASEAQANAMNMVDKLREADGIYTPNETITFGMLLTLRQNHLTGKAKFVGFDATPPLIDALQNGEIQALVAQNPNKMGYEAMKMVVASLRRQPFENQIDSGALLITPDNLHTPEAQAFLGTN